MTRKCPSAYIISSENTVENEKTMLNGSKKTSHRSRKSTIVTYYASVIQRIMRVRPGLAEHLLRGVILVVGVAAPQAHVLDVRALLAFEP